MENEVFVSWCNTCHYDISKEGWVTELPVSQLEEKGYVNIKELKKAFWRYVGKMGAIVTNANIDYIVEMALKEMKGGE